MLIIINIMSTAPRKRLFCPRSIKSSISLSCPFASLYSTRYVHLLIIKSLRSRCRLWTCKTAENLFSIQGWQEISVLHFKGSVSQFPPTFVLFVYIMSNATFEWKKKKKKATLSLFSSFWHGNSCGAIWPGALSPFSWMGQPGPQCCAGETLVFES